MMARDILGKLMLMVMGLVLAMVPNTTQRAVVGPYVGLVLSTTYDESLLLESGSYVPNYSIKKGGRFFNVGSFNGVPVVYVVALPPIAYVSATVQILIDTFEVIGVIDYGNSATVNPSIKMADVVVLNETAFSSIWTWEDYKGIVNSEEATELPTLKIGEYNVPEAGDNELGSIKFVNSIKYTEKGLTENNFWYFVDATWLKIAENLKDIKLERCIKGICAEEVPSVVFGLRGSTSDIYLENEAYGKFLHEKLGVSTVDQTSAASISSVVANKVRHIIFRAASNRPGMPHDSSISTLASRNNLKVVSSYIKLLSEYYYQQPLSE